MAAPLPPPANAPISAPAPAPPPMKPAERLPLPLIERATMPVSTEVSLPLIDTELSRTSSSAPPLKCPMPFASTTVPRAAAPLSITVFPSTATGSATVAEKPCPALLSLELSVSPRRTVITVPTGMVTTCGTGLLAADLPDADLLPAAPPAALSPAALGLSVEDAGVAGLLAHPITKHSASSATTYNLRVDFKRPPSSTLVCLCWNYSRSLRAIFLLPQQLLGSLVQCPQERLRAEPRPAELLKQVRCSQPVISPGNSLS